MAGMRMMYAQPLLISYVLFLPVLIFSIFAFLLSLVNTVKQKIKPHFTSKLRQIRRHR